MLDQKKIKDLEIFAAKIRLETFKELVSLGFGHVGGAMSIAETLAVLYGEVMRVDPANPQWDGRDYFALSKGHAGPALYATLALKGFFPLEKLATLNQNGTMLPSHCSRVHTPGVDLTTGSLGLGISAALGVALGAYVLEKQNRAFCIVGDGECDEGQIWEAALFAAHHKLDNFFLVIDDNKVQLDGNTDDICALGDLAAKFSAFDWHAQRVDGHDVGAILEAFNAAQEYKGKPHVIVIDTVKGKGCLIAEEAARNHQMNHAMPFPDKAQNEAEIRRMEACVAALEAERSAL